MRQPGVNSASLVRPQHFEVASISMAKREVEVSEKVGDNMQERADDLVRRITELEEKLVREEGRRPIVSPVPERPTDEEVAEHNLTHTPPKPWCPYCTKAIGLRDPHARIRKDVP